MVWLQGLELMSLRREISFDAHFQAWLVETPMELSVSKVVAVVVESLVNDGLRFPLRSELSRCDFNSRFHRSALRR